MQSITPTGAHAGLFLITTLPWQPGSAAWAWGNFIYVMPLSISWDCEDHVPTACPASPFRCGVTPK